MSADAFLEAFYGGRMSRARSPRHRAPACPSAQQLHRDVAERRQRDGLRTNFTSMGLLPACALSGEYRVERIATRPAVADSRSGTGCISRFDRGELGVSAVPRARMTPRAHARGAQAADAGARAGRSRRDRRDAEAAARAGDTVERFAQVCACPAARLVHENPPPPEAFHEARLRPRSKLRLAVEHTAFRVELAPSAISISSG